MGTNTAPIEGYETAEVEREDDGDDVPEIDLAEDGPVAGTVVNIRSGEDDRGPWHLLTVLDDDQGLVKVWAKWDVKQHVNSGRIREGTDVCLYVDDSEERTLPDSDESQHPHKAAFPEASD
ncbi:hypothetical protein L593_13670 [Salinarchaeum sp. Harcht-Bsk1]|uniref:hypothetical protein n=1 Tax=Salinarchaeum sp. Harcht-Bsk1 TaxID=1333523 RepID=UPI00034247F8|nr:hypothetical protein [Salinarchaeum sp. Harcht-Bsk1]AGN02673.1 hypothetical protein L593_13670 [Salinarchaeum sp. Harcht-Bsk1]